jgi:hypothetical protein
MRALIALSAAALLATACETAFVGRGPGGRYELVEVNGRAVPAERSRDGQCIDSIASGHFELDSIARRFEMVLRETRSCSAASHVLLQERGSYLRDEYRLKLETDPGAGVRRSWTAGWSGNAITLAYQGMRLRFRQAERPRRP